MKRHIAITILIAVVAAIFVPRDLREASHLLAKVAVTIANLSVELLKHDGYDPGFVESGEDEAPQQDAGLRAGSSLRHIELRHFPNTPMPEGRGCQVTRCEDLWDDDLNRPFRRCHWRCPRPEPPEQEFVPTPPSQREAEPEYIPQGPSFEVPVLKAETAKNSADTLFAILFGVFVVVIVATIARGTGGSTQKFDRAMNAALNEATEAVAARAKLEQAVEEAEYLIQRQVKGAYERGRRS